jgi:AcrR family transcriptional regulator
MSPKNRRPNREEVRMSILQTARDIAATDGWSCATVRKVAERIGYTAPIIYEHFGSKDEMLNQILKEGYITLAEVISTATQSASNSEDRIRAIIIAYWDFVHTNREIYQLMYGMEGARATSNEAREYAAPIVKIVTKELIRYNPEQITPENVIEVMVAAWSMIHGMIALELSGYTTRYVESDRLPETLVSNTLSILKRQ